MRQAQESLEREMAVCQRVTTSQLEEVDLWTNDELKPVNVAKEMTLGGKMAMIKLLKEFRDMFA